MKRKTNICAIHRHFKSHCSESYYRAICILQEPLRNKCLLEKQSCFLWTSACSKSFTLVRMSDYLHWPQEIRTVGLKTAFIFYNQAIHHSRECLSTLKHLNTCKIHINSSKRHGTRFSTTVLLSLCSEPFDFWLHSLRLGIALLFKRTDGQALESCCVSAETISIALSTLLVLKKCPKS